MPRMALDDRRSVLVGAALDVVKRNGVVGATTRAIVAEAGMPLGAFHYVFSSRDELLGAVVEQVAQLDRLAAEPALWAAVPADASPALRDVLLDGMTRYIDHLEADPYSQLAFLELALHGARQDLDDKVSRQRYSVAYSAPEYLLARAARLSGSEWTAPLPFVARLLVGTLDGLTLAWLADHDGAAARASAAFHADALATLAGPLATASSTTSTASTSTAHETATTTEEP